MSSKTINSKLSTDDIISDKNHNYFCIFNNIVLGIFIAFFLFVLYKRVIGKDDFSNLSDILNPLNPSSPLKPYNVVNALNSNVNDANIIDLVRLFISNQKLGNYSEYLRYLNSIGNNNKKLESIETYTKLKKIYITNSKINNDDIILLLK